MLSLPIPDDRSSIKYQDIAFPGLSFSSLVEQLTKGVVKRTHGAHLDPDIRCSALGERHPSWRGVFGQVGASQTHLASRISIGDIFLFFGWFRRIESRNGLYRYVRDAPDCHVLFGWLQVGNILPANFQERPGWVDYHPHCHERFIASPSGTNSTLYIATDRLRIDCEDLGFRGYGTFSRLKRILCLTYPDQPKRSVWSLPTWFYPFDSGRTPLSYHGDPGRWAFGDNHCTLTIVPRGQEFVLNSEEYPEAARWVLSLLGAV